MAESLSPLKRWLHFIDEQLNSEAVEYLKLGLHSEFYPFYGDVQKLDKPSQLYYFLLERCMKGSESKTLKMFVHVVRGLGGSLRGHHVTTEAFGVNSTYNIRDPGPFNLKKASVNFKFFQSLLKISTKARRTALGEQLKKKFSKSRFLNINHRLIKNLSQLFIKLFQKKLISAVNTHHLVEALSKYKAWLCLRVLNEYHTSVGLQPIALAQGMEAYICAIDSSSSDPSSIDESSDNVPTSERAFRQSFYEGTELEFIDENDPVVFSYRSTVSVNNPCRPDQQGKDSDDDSDASIIDSSETDIMMKKDAAAKGQLNFGSNKIMVIGSTGRRSNRGYKVGCSLLIISLVFMVIVSIVLAFKLWMPLKPPAMLHMSVLQDSKVVLTEVHPVFHKTVMIDRDWEGGNLTSTHVAESDVVIDFYGIGMSCNHMIETDNAMVTSHSLEVYLTDKNMSSYLPIYALKGSTFDYQISGKNTTESRVKFVDVCVYSGSNFNKGTRLECTKVLLRGGSGYFFVRESGYYFFKVETSGVSVQYLLSVTENLKMLNFNTKSLLDCAINVTNNHCQFDLPKVNEYCLMAEFYHTVNDVSEIELKVQGTNSRITLMLVLPLAIIMCLFIIISVSLLVLVFCCCVRIRNLYRHSTVV